MKLTPRYRHALPANFEKSQRGLSLVELMIAMALGLILTLGVTQIYLSGSASYSQTQGFAHAQESTRFVSAILTPDLRSAGTFGCLARMGRPLNQVVDNRLNGGLAVPVNQALQGWEFNGTGPGNNFTLAAAINTPGAASWASGTAGNNLPAALAGDVIANSDVMIINALAPLGVPVDGANPQNGASINLVDESGADAGRVILAVDERCSLGELFQNTNNANATALTMAGGNVNPGNNGNDFNVDYGDEDGDPLTIPRAYEFTATAYYIGRGTSGEPALFRRQMTPLSPPQELISGVETIQFLYGVNTVGTNAADAYLPADQVVDWTSIVSVRFSTMTRSQDEVLTEVNDRSFDLLGSEVSQANNGDRRARLVSVGTTALRGIMQ